jgi:DNA-binding transcriptional LysR family regulator
VDFDLRQLEIFCKVVELQSFTKAAAAVHLAQASVSERIANLERSVGVQLLDRLGRQVVPTKIGQRLYERAVELLDARRDLCIELEELLGVERGSLLIGASTIPGEYILPTELARFRQRRPGVLVRVLGGDSASIATLIAAGEVELGFVGSRTKQEGLRFQPLWDDELVVAVPAKHRWRRRKTIALADLVSEPFVLREPGSGTRRTMEEAMREAGVETQLAVVAELGSTAAVKQAVVQGLGISVLSRRALDLELAAGAVSTLRIKGLSLRRHFYLAWDRRRARSPLCREFADFVTA